MKNNIIKYRYITSSEYFFLKEMLYLALFVPPDHLPFPYSIIEHPDIEKYISNWGTQDGDIAIVATTQNQLIGAVWGRLFSNSDRGYGFVSEQIPEISMAIKQEYRNLGIGTILIKEIERAYLQLNITLLSLSVDKRNPALRLYKRAGFVKYSEEGTALTLLKK